MLQPSDSECFWNEMDQLGKFPGFTYQSTIQSFKRAGYLLPWWNNSCGPDENPKDEYTTDEILLSDIDQETLVQAEESPSASQVIDDMAIEVFSDASQKQDYYHQAEKCDLTQNEWYNHYNLLAFNAYNLECSIGTQTAVSWALCCFKWMPERVLSKKSRFELLLKLCFTWYNFMLEFKLRCAANEEDILKSFNICRESFDKLVVKCELEEEDKDVVNSFLNLIKAALLSRIYTEQNSEAENYLKEFLGRYKVNPHFPKILIALYYYEAASMAYVKGDVVALDHLKMAFNHLLSSNVAENLKWKYLLDVVYDLARFYSKVNSEAKSSNKEICDIVYSTLEQKKSDKIDSPNDVLLEVSLCYLAIVLGKNSEADCCLADIFDFCEIYESTGDLFLPKTSHAMYICTLVSFVTAVYPHFASTPEIDLTPLITFVIDNIEIQTFGYKYVFNATFLLASIQYHQGERDVNVFLAKRILSKIDIACATPEILSYYLIVTILKGVSYCQLDKLDDGKELLSKASIDSLKDATFYELAHVLGKSIRYPSSLQKCVSFLNEFPPIVATGIIILAGDQFREKFPSADENEKVLLKIFSYFSEECKFVFEKTDE